MPKEKRYILFFYYFQKVKKEMQKHELPALPFAYDALEPFIDEQTMHFHHDKHHQAYADKFNAALEKHPWAF